MILSQAFGRVPPEESEQKEFPARTVSPWMENTQDEDQQWEKGQPIFYPVICRVLFFLLDESFDKPTLHRQDNQGCKVGVSR